MRLGPVGTAAVVCRATAHKCAVEVKRGVDRVVRVVLKFVFRALDENHSSETSDSKRLLLCAPGEMCA